MHATISLGEISLTLQEVMHGGACRPLTQLALVGAKLDVKQRPAAKAMAVEFALRDLVVQMVRFNETLQPVMKSLPAIADGTVRVFRQKFTLEDAIGPHASSLEALACV
jgi:hypothetical protein